MVNLKDVFTKVKVPRPQMSARSVYSTTPKQRREYLTSITKAKAKATEYNKYIDKKRIEYIKNQEAFRRRLAELRKATKRYETSRADISEQINALQKYETQLEKQYRKLQERKRSSSNGTRYLRRMRDKPSPIGDRMSRSSKVSRPKRYSSPIQRIIRNPLDRFM